KQKTAYEIQGDWSSDVCSSDLGRAKQALSEDRVCQRMRRKQVANRLRMQKKYGGKKSGEHACQGSERPGRLPDVAKPKHGREHQGEPWLWGGHQRGRGAKIRGHQTCRNRAGSSCAHLPRVPLRRKLARRPRISRWPSCPGLASGSARCKTENPCELPNLSPFCKSGICAS